MMKYVAVLWILANCLISDSKAQEKSDSAAEELTATLQQQEAINPFEHLISADSIVYQLRKKYGVKGSAELSRTLWNILLSYNSQQQSHDIWQKSIMTISGYQPDEISPSVNFSFISGQILSQYTRGMNMEMWLKDRSPLAINNNNITEFLQYGDDLTIYLHLPEVWQLILTNIIRHENINWNEVFQDSFTLFSSQEKTTHPQSDKLSFFEALMQWNENPQQLPLADLMTWVASTEGYNQNIFTAFLRFSLNKRSQNYIAAALNWQELAYYLYTESKDFNEKDSELIGKYIESGNKWFTEHEEHIQSINPELLTVIMQSTEKLEQSFLPNGPDNSNTNFGFNYGADTLSIYHLVEPGFDKYMSIPFRQQIVRELEVCLNISREFEPYPQLPIVENQFTGCIRDFVRAATEDTKSRELAGSLTKIDTKEAFDRALELPAWQIMNILYAYKVQAECLDENEQLINPLEWTLAAESLLWFTDRWPNFLKLYPSVIPEIQKVATQGEVLQSKFNCLDSSYTDILDSDFDKIDRVWQGMKADIKQIAQEFNNKNLRDDSDVDLLSDTLLKSNYKVKDAMVTACDAQKSCGVHIELESSRALFGLFPNNLLIADQLKLGNLRLCYDNVGWEDRRAAPTHLENDNVADYYGKLSFSLKGYYDNELVFEKKLTDDEEHHYLFASSNESVLEQYCPLSLVGGKISTQLKRGTFGLVPNRLTFLTASRADEAKIFAANWIEGKEWRDKFISNDNTNPSVSNIYENRLDELTPAIQQTYQQKAGQLQQVIYQAMLNLIPEPTDVQKKLTSDFEEMIRSEQLLTAMLYFLQPDSYLLDDTVHSVLFGNHRLVAKSVITQSYKNQLKINMLIEMIDKNIENSQQNWNKFDKNGSNSYLNETLLKLKSIK